MNNISKVQSEIEKILGSKLIVPEKLTKPNKLIEEAKKNMEAHKSTRYLFDGFIDYRQGISFRVQPENMSRALRFMDTLIKAMLALGHSVNYDHVKNHLVFKIMEENFEIGFREKSKRMEVESKYTWNRFTKVPTGIFILQATGWLSEMAVWKDGKQPIENQLSKILETLEIMSTKITEERLKWKKRQELRVEEIKREKEEELSIENEVKKVKQLIRDTELWRISKDIREYVQDGMVRDQLHSKKEIKWARGVADWIDPTTQRPSRLLTEKHKSIICGL